MLKLVQQTVHYELPRDSFCQSTLRMATWIESHSQGGSGILWLERHRNLDQPDDNATLWHIACAQQKNLLSFQVIEFTILVCRDTYPESFQ
jgi:hypothetical protein